MNRQTVDQTDNWNIQHIDERQKEHTRGLMSELIDGQIDGLEDGQT